MIRVVTWVHYDRVSARVRQARRVPRSGVRAAPGVSGVTWCYLGACMTVSVRVRQARLVLRSGIRAAPGVSGVTWCYLGAL